MNAAAIGWGAVTFLAIKVVFSALAWYWRDEDARYRKHLDKAFDRLEDGTLFEFVHSLLVHLVRRVGETFPDKRKALRRFAGWSLLAATIAVVAGAELYEWFAWRYPENIWRSERETRVGSSDYFLGKGVWVTVSPRWQPLGPVEPVVSTLVILPFAALLTVTSLVITWRLLKRAARAATFSTLLVHLVLDVLVTVALFLSINAAYAVYSRLAIDSTIPVVQFFWFNVRETMQLWSIVFGSLPTEVTQFEMRMMFLGVSIAAPTLLYFAMGAVALLARILPKRVKEVLAKLVYLVTTDKEPVLAQVGNVAGVVSGLLAAFTKLTT